MFHCKLCRLESASYRGISTHVSKSHKKDLKSLGDLHNEIPTAARKRFFEMHIEEIDPTVSAEAEAPQNQQTEEVGKDASTSSAEAGSHPASISSLLDKALGMHVPQPAEAPLPAVAAMVTSASLSYELPADLRSMLMDWDEGTAIPHHELVTLAADLIATEGGVEEKFDAVCCMLRVVEGHALVAKDEAFRLVQRRKKAEHMARRLRGVLRACMETNAMPRVDTGRFSLRLQKSPLRVLDVDPHRAPPWAREPRLEYHVHRKAIADHIRSNDGEVPAWAQVSQGVSLRIS